MDSCKLNFVMLGGISTTGRGMNNYPAWTDVYEAWGKKEKNKKFESKNWS